MTDAFTGATERHIEVGDGLEMFVIEKGKGVRLVSLREYLLSLSLLLGGVFVPSGGRAGFDWLLMVCFF